MLATGFMRVAKYSLGCGLFLPALLAAERSPELPSFPSPRGRPSQHPGRSARESTTQSFGTNLENSKPGPCEERRKGLQMQLWTSSRVSKSAGRTPHFQGQRASERACQESPRPLAPLSRQALFDEQDGCPLREGRKGTNANENGARETEEERGVKTREARVINLRKRLIFL